MGAGPKKCSQPQPPGPQPFFIVDSGSRATAGFPLKKAGKPPGGPGGDAPWHVFAFFLRAKKEGGPQARPEKDGYSGLSVHTMRRQPDQEVDGAPPNPPYMI